MRGMRNRMIHNYFDINVDVVWNTIKEDLPQLKQQIDGLLIGYRREQQHQQEQDLKTSKSGNATASDNLIPIEFVLSLVSRH